MFQDIMRVTRSCEATWSVCAGARWQSRQDFRIKSHAVAYARARSCAERLTLFIDDDSGKPVRQTRESLTYPVDLD